MATAVLTWNANTEADLAGYQIYRGLDTSTPTLLTTVAKVMTYTDTSLLDTSQTVRYQLTAVDLKGNVSARTPEVSVTIDKTPPTTPTGFSVTVTVNVTTP